MVSSRKIRLSPDAEDDLADILQFTAERWSVEQAATYKATLFGALRSLADFPNLGMARNDLQIGYRSHRVEQHVIFYRVEPAAIHVVRILHVRRDPTEALREELAP